MENEVIIGLQPKNHTAFVSFGFVIQKAVNEKNASGTDSAKEILESLEKPLLQNQNAFVPTVLTHIETIVVNLRVLINDKLN